jgi:transcriptional regulator with XRE-family HTH domain
MPNERLQALLLERGMTPANLSEAVQVDPKTIERWIAARRVPYRRHRYSVATFFGVERGMARVRILLSDPDSLHVAERSTSEGIDEGMAARS